MCEEEGLREALGGRDEVPSPSEASSRAEGEGHSKRGEQERGCGRKVRKKEREMILSVILVQRNVKD